MSEHDEQVALFQIFGLQEGRFPELRWAFAVPNGIPLSGKSRFAVINHMKAEGLRPGVADVFIPAPRSGWHGCFLELKRVDGGELSDLQKAFLEGVEQAGYYTIVAHGANEAWELVEAYLSEWKEG